MKLEGDALLAARAAKGDESAFEEIVDTYQHMVYNLCITKLGSREDALDVSQDTFLRVYRAIGDFRGQSKLSSWIYRICLNCIADHQRKKKSTIPIEKDSDGEGGLDVADESVDADPEYTAVKNERQRAVRKAIMSLPDEARQLIVLREFEGYSYSEIAEITGVEVGTVKSRLNRAREKIKKYLEQGNFIT